MRRFGLIALVLVYLLNSCSSNEKINGSTEDETYFLRGKAYFEDETYDMAESYLSKVKNKYPYSQYVVDAEFLLAKCAYYQSHYVLAEQAFMVFVDLHPNSKYFAEAKYFRAMCIYKQVSKSKDRDISMSEKAIVAFRESMSTDYAIDALEKITEIKRLQAERVLYIANFYKKRDNCLSAIERYQELIKKFDFIDLKAEAQEGISYCEGVISKSARNKNI